MASTPGRHFHCVLRIIFYPVCSNPSSPEAAKEQLCLGVVSCAVKAMSTVQIEPGRIRYFATLQESNPVQSGPKRAGFPILPHIKLKITPFES